MIDPVYTNKYNLNEPMDSPLKNRLYSLLWRTGGMVAVVLLSFLIENAGELNIPTYGTMFAGLIVGEITKYLNK